MPRVGHDESRQVVWLKDTFNLFMFGEKPLVPAELVLPTTSPVLSAFLSMLLPDSQTSSLAELPDLEKDGIHSICQPLALVSFFPTSKSRTPSSGICA